MIGMASGGPVHIHIAEQTKEVEDCRALVRTSPRDLAHRYSRCR